MYSRQYMARIKEVSILIPMRELTSDEVLDELQSIFPSHKRPSLRTLQRYADEAIVSKPKTFYESGNIGRLSYYPNIVVSEFYAAQVLLKQGMLRVPLAELPKVRKLAMSIEGDQWTRETWNDFQQRQYYDLPTIWRWLVETKRIAEGRSLDELLWLNICFEEGADRTGRVKVELSEPTFL